MVFLQRFFGSAPSIHFGSLARNEVLLHLHPLLSYPQVLTDNLVSTFNLTNNFLESGLFLLQQSQSHSLLLPEEQQADHFSLRGYAEKGQLMSEFGGDSTRVDAVRVWSIWC